MPFTFAHPAAVIPVHHVLRRYSVLSALIIGSMVPDFQNFLPFDIERSESHSLAGLFWFYLPLGLVLYFTFHLILEKPLQHLLPPKFAARYATLKQGRYLPSTSGPLIVLSLLLGSFSHLAWDACTHRSIVTEVFLPPLSAYLFSIGNYHVYAYKLLQHLSTLAGTAIVLKWMWRTLAAKQFTQVRQLTLITQASQVPSLKPLPTLPASTRHKIISSLLLAPLLLSIILTAHTYSLVYPAMAWHEIIREFVVTTISNFGSLLIIYSLVWHSFLRHSQDATK